MNHAIDLNPAAFRLEAWKITYPYEGKGGRAKTVFKIEPMRFVPHSGSASA